MGVRDNRQRFPYVGSVEELMRTPEAEKGFISPGGAAIALGVDRTYIRLLEQRGHLTGYRIRQHRHWVVNLLSSKPLGSGHDEVFVAVESVRAFAKKQGRPILGIIPPED